MFNRELKTGSSGVIAGSEITEQVWNYLRSAGVPAIQGSWNYGNMRPNEDFLKLENVIHGNGIGFGWRHVLRTT